jgi:hypothetical protein
MMRWLALCFLGSAFVFPIGPPNHHTNTPTAPLFRWIAAEPGGYEEETIGFITRQNACGGGLSSELKDAYDDLIKDSHDNGWRNAFASLNLVVATNKAGAGCPVFISTNHISPEIGYSNHVLTGFADSDFSLTHGLYKAFPDYIDTGIAPKDVTPHGMLFVAPRIIMGAGRAYMGARSSSGAIECELLQWNADSNVLNRLGGQAAHSLSSSVSNRVFLATHDSGGTIRLYSSDGFSSAAASYPMAGASNYTNSIMVGTFSMSDGSPYVGVEAQESMYIGGYGITVGITSNQAVAAIRALTNFYAKVGRDVK